MTNIQWIILSLMEATLPVNKPTLQSVALLVESALPAFEGRFPHITLIRECVDLAKRAATEGQTAGSVADAVDRLGMAFFEGEESKLRHRSTIHPHDGWEPWMGMVEAAQWLISYLRAGSQAHRNAALGHAAWAAHYAKGGTGRRVTLSQLVAPYNVQPCHG